MTENYQLVFQAQTTFQRVYVNIAVDDIKVSPAAVCQSQLSTTTLAPVTTATPPSPYDCNFENNTCTWAIDTSTGQ